MRVGLLIKVWAIYMEFAGLLFKMTFELLIYLSIDCLWIFLFQERSVEVVEEKEWSRCYLWKSVENLFED